MKLKSKLTRSSKIFIDHRNKRLKAYDSEDNIELLTDYAKKEGLEKIIVFQKENRPIETYSQNGFIQEGKIDGFFDGESALLLAKYIDETRHLSSNIKAENKILQSIQLEANTNSIKSYPDGYNIRNAVLYYL